MMRRIFNGWEVAAIAGQGCLIGFNTGLASERGDWYSFALNIVPAVVIGMYVWAAIILARVERRAGG